MDLLDKLAKNIQHFPNKLALEFIDPPYQQLRYADLDEWVTRSVSFLNDLGLEPGDRLALQLPKCQEFVFLHLAAMRLGAITLPLNPAYPPTELSYFLSDSEAKVFVGDRVEESALSGVLNQLVNLEHKIFLDPRVPEDYAAMLGPNSDRSALVEAAGHDPDATAVMIYTSGTTGRPKGAQITHRNLAANLDALHTAWGWQAGDVLLHALPIFHVHGLIVALLGALNAGASALLLRKFDAHRVLESLSTRQCTVFMGVPTMYHRLLAEQDVSSYDLSHMRLFTSGSDRLPDEVFQAFQRTFGHTLLERYGMTETGMNLSNPLHGERRIGSVGLPLPGVEARVVDPETGELLPDGQVGEVQIRGNHVFKGYWRQPEKSAEAFTTDGWLHTGDLGLREPDGYYTLKGRAKDLIITGGLNVYPPEVERVLAEHPAVAACAVIGCPDPQWGERIVAVVQLRAGAVISSEDLMEYCRDRLAAYKIPRSVRLVKALPRNALGKVQKVRLREEYCRNKI
jgi:malonyl-CoA/methylmalonyl-CoA synthetase